MKDLLEKLKSENNLTEEQSLGILNTIKDYIKDKFPMLGGAVDNLFAESENADNEDSFLEEGTNNMSGTTVKEVDDLSKKTEEKVHGFFEGNKKDY